MDEITKEFLVESFESLDRLDRDLLALESGSSDASTIASIFRTMHTIKGTSGFLAFQRLEALTHAAESLLSQLRDGLFDVDTEITSALLATNDAVRAMLASIDRDGTDGTRDHAKLIARLSALPRSRAPGIAISEAPEAVVETAVESTSNHGGSKVSDTSIRVDVGLLERLMSLVGELVLARNQVLQYSVRFDDSQFLHTSRRLDAVTTELQEGVKKTRMQPIGNNWSMLPRVVRDLALSCGKRVRIEMDGEETELDRSLLEAIRDPLTHIVRNAIDHGIEEPTDRVTAGKDPEGVLRLSAHHEGGQVHVEVTDDGRGIDLDRVRATAIQRAIVAADVAAAMNDREITNLIFRPGFSTMSHVTNLSGRGVGMDVVKSNIEKIGGTVDVRSRLGEGTTVRIKVPLTLAIVPALTVSCAGDRYAIPQVSLLELVRLTGEDAKRRVEDVHGSLVHRLRGRLLPLVFLSDELGLEKDRRSREIIESIGDEVNIVVLQADGRPFGLVVDHIQDTEEIVVKPLGKHIQGILAFAGTTIMGDGRVALILDVRGLAQMSGVLGLEAHEAERAPAKAKSQGVAQTRTLLLVQVGRDGRMAIPLSQVTRLEEIARSDIELAGGHPVVQYRGALLPLLHLSSLIPSAGGIAREAADATETAHVVVHASGDRSIGIEVDRILDIVSEEIHASREATLDWILETVVIQGKVTEVLDLDWLLSRAALAFHGASQAAGV